VILVQHLSEPGFLRGGFAEQGLDTALDVPNLLQERYEFFAEEFAIHHPLLERPGFGLIVQILRALLEHEGEAVRLGGVGWFVLDVLGGHVYGFLCGCDKIGRAHV